MSDRGVEGQLHTWVLQQRGDEVFIERPEEVEMPSELEVWFPGHIDGLIVWMAVQDATTNVK